MHQIRRTILAGIGALSLFVIPVCSGSQKAVAAVQGSVATAHPHISWCPATQEDFRQLSMMVKPMHRMHWEVQPIEFQLAHAMPQASTPGPSHRAPSRANRPYHKVISSVSIPGLPATLVPVYKAAGQRYGIPWTVLAAIHRTETDFATTDSPVSSMGALGPMQFLPATFAEYQVAAPGHHRAPNIEDVRDAIYTTAHMLYAKGFSRNPAAAIYAYNHSTAYVKRVMTLAGLS